MLVYLDDKKIEIKKILQDAVTDLDLLKEKPIAFKKGKYFIIAQPVRVLEHDEFLQQMAMLIIKYYDIFNQIDLLSAFDYKKQGVLEQVVNSLAIFQASKKYHKFIKDAYKFCVKWCYVATEKNKYAKRRRFLSKRIIAEFNPAELIYFLYCLFVFNYDIVKKNTIQFLAMFKGIEINGMQSQSDISSRGMNKKAVIMPAYSEKPFNASILALFEEQSKQ